MQKIFFVVLLSLLCGSVSAQDVDTLIAVRKGPNWAIRHIIQPKETLTMLARRFYVTVDDIETINDNEVIRRFPIGSVIIIPVIRPNYLVSKPPLDMSNLQELYYKVGPKDDISLISTYAGVMKNEMRSWNSLKGNTLVVDQVLFIGWVRMMVRDSTNPVAEAAYPPNLKQAAGMNTISENQAKVLGALDSLFNVQTNDNTNVLNEKGTAVFFDKPGKVTMYYAFHNATPRGTIIKVYNPGTGKTIYAKVLGPLPKTKLYANSIIGICNGAKEELGVNDNKAWCELTYTAD